MKPIIKINDNLMIIDPLGWMLNGMVSRLFRNGDYKSASGTFVTKFDYSPVASGEVFGVEPQPSFHVCNFFTISGFFAQYCKNSMSCRSI